MTFSGNPYQGGSLAQMGVGFEDYSPNGSYIYQDDLTWIRGKHSFNFGYDFRRYYYNDRGLSDAGHFTFTPRSTDLPGFLNDTGHAFASFLLGGANNASHNIVGYSQGFRQPQHALYAMDDWKITPNLTLNLGFRWEIIPPFYEVTDRMSEIDLNVPNPEAGNLPGAQKGLTTGFGDQAFSAVRRQSDALRHAPALPPRPGRSRPGRGDAPTRRWQRRRHEQSHRAGASPKGAR